MKIGWFVSVIALGILLVSGLACGGDGPAPTPTRCELDRDAIQAAFYVYHDETGEWPTADGGPGDIAWYKLVPDFIGGILSTDRYCDWHVNSDPEGEICLWEEC